MKLFWRWVGVLLIFVPWSLVIGAAEFFLHLLRIPHWH